MKDRLDGYGIAWFESRATEGERCCVCRAPLPRGRRILVERILPGIGGRPKCQHMRCWARYANVTADAAQP